MERKIGEIFEYKGKWYQCLEEKTCTCFGCDFRNYTCDDISLQEVKGSCQSERRKDNKSVIFKKLEKVGGTYAHNSVIVQKYRIIVKPVIMPNEPYMYFNAINNTIDIEIKQNKEEMEENKLNLKPFDLEQAKAGKPVCTRDGRKARIICFDRDWDRHIVALVSDSLGESVHYYLSNGKFDFDKQNDDDLMMLPEKKEGWVNVYKDSVYNTKEEALAGRSECRGYIDTIKLSWEE